MNQSFPPPSLRQFGLALLGGELIEGLGLLAAQEGLMVVLEALRVVVLVVAQVGVVVNPLLLRRNSESDHGQQTEPLQ